MILERFRSTKLIKGFSTCFRQWPATDTRCKFLHGYSIEFEVTFQGHLDHRSWVVDFGFMKRSSTKIDNLNVKDWFDMMFDHTTVIAEDDPFLDHFKHLEREGVLQLRILPKVGCEKFAELVFHKLNEFLKVETSGRCSVIEVKCIEHELNSASYLQTMIS